MPNPKAPLPHTHRLLGALTAGALVRVVAAWLGFGLWNAGHDHLHMLKLAQAQDPKLAGSLSAVDPSTGFGDGLLRPLLRFVIDVLHALGLDAPEDLVLAVGILAVVLRVAIALGLWRLARGYFGASRLGHPAWLVVGFVQGALCMVLIGGVLALGPTPEAQLMVGLREDAQARAVVALGPRLEPYFLGGRTLVRAQNDTLDETWLRQTLTKMELAETAANRFVFFAKDRDKSEIMLILEGQSCHEPTVYVGSWLDRLAVRLDPLRHAHRGALLVYRCSGTDVAWHPAMGPPAARVGTHRMR